MSKNYFITFEGIDGSGKDTQLFELLKQIKENDNYPFGDKYSTIWVTREPTKITNKGREISRLLKTKEGMTGEQATELYTSDRKQHSRIIEQILSHSHVLCSRYDVSTLTYQVSQGMDFEDLYEIHDYGSDNGSLIPDLTLVFDLPAEVAAKRVESRGGDKEFFEEIEFQKKVKRNQDFCVKKLRDKGRKIVVINADQSVGEVTEEMLEKIYEELNRNG